MNIFLYILATSLNHIIIIYYGIYKGEITEKKTMDRIVLEENLDIGTFM